MATLRQIFKITTQTYIFLTSYRCNRIFVKIVFLFYKEKLSTFTCQNTREVILTLKYLYHVDNNSLVLI